jgi:hypothetical protein
MIVNNVGKLLVLLHLAVSIVVLCWAVMLFIQPVDWGWKEPRKAWHDPPEGKKEPANERVASRIDERVAAWGKLQENRARAMAAVKKAEKPLKDMEMGFAENHLYYAKELKRLESAEKIDPKEGIAEVQFIPKDGRPQLKPPAPWGLPTFGKPLTTKVEDKEVPLDKSYAGYLADLLAKLKDIQQVQEKIGGRVDKDGNLVLDDKGKPVKEGWINKLKAITLRLNGEHDDEGKLKEPGLYVLVEAEAEAQRKVREELDYLQPIWVTALYNAQLFRARRHQLEERLTKLGVSPSSVLP